MKKVLIIICISVLTLFIAIAGAGRFFYHNSLYLIKGQVDVGESNFESSDINSEKSSSNKILLGAKEEVSKKTKYRSAYYQGGYPPDNEGVCTDVIWRALKNAGIDLKSNIDKDIKQNPKDYAGSVSVPDPNIDFRRVQNQYIYLKKYTENLTTRVIPYDKTNLAEWQPGDIVVLKNSEHIAIISNNRRRDGVPLILHNANSYAKEEDRLMDWSSDNRIIGHFRYNLK